MSKFFCDSNCELWWDEAEALGITYISMPYTLDGEEYYYDLGKNTDIPEFFNKMRGGSVAKTSALNAHEYTQYFEPVLAGGEDIIYVTFSHKMSGTFNSMNAAIAELKEKYPERKITVVDSTHISLAAGYVVRYAAIKHNEGASDEEVAAFVEGFRRKVNCYFTVADLVYLKRGGRISSFKAMMGTLLDIKPRIRNTDGALDNFDKSKGRKRSIKDLVGDVEKANPDLSYPITLLNADSPDDLELCKELFREHFPNAEIREQFVGPVIGSHCGPDTIGVIFVSHDEH